MGPNGCSEGAGYAVRPQQSLYLRAPSRDQRLGLGGTAGFGGDPHQHVLTVDAEGDGRVVAREEDVETFGHLRLPHTRRAHDLAVQHLTSGHLDESRHDVPVEHGRHLRGDTRQHEHPRVAVPEGHPERETDVVRQRLRALRHVGHPQHAVEHHSPAFQNDFVDVLRMQPVATELEAGHGAQGVLGDVVTGRTDTARDDDDVRSPASGGEDGRDPVEVVADRDAVVGIEPDGGQPLGNDRGVGVDDLADQQLGPHGDDLGDHRVTPSGC